MERMAGYGGSDDLYRFRRDDFDRLVEMGAFTDARVELLHGLLVAKEPQGPEHAALASRIHKKLLLALQDRADVRSHSPFAVSDDSEPEPDVAVVPRLYAVAVHPTEAWLLVEIARSSLARDRGMKADLYARAGVPEYWIVNLVDDCLEVRDQPANGVYRRLRTLGAGERVTLVAFPDVSFDVAELLAT